MKSAVTLEEIYTPIESGLQAVPEAILDILSTPNELAQDVIRYFFSGRGKLLRPALTFLGAELKGIDPSYQQRLLHLAASFEIFHGATLIHDDIIDSAYLRRNIPTINAKWNSEVAVLVGDYLHDKAIGTIFKNGNEKIVSLFLQTAGTVCDGEIHELKEKGNFHLSEEEYLEIVEKKTASLLACTLEAGAVLAQATPEEACALNRFGIYFGIAFQIVDDCLDFTGNENEFGKTLGADYFAGVLTLPAIRLMALSNPEQKRKIIELFRSSESREQFQTLLQWMREYETIDYSIDKARKFSEMARQELAIFPASSAKNGLDRLLDHVLERNR